MSWGQQVCKKFRTVYHVVVHYAVFKTGSKNNNTLVYKDNRLDFSSSLNYSVIAFSSFSVFSLLQYAWSLTVPSFAFSLLAILGEFLLTFNFVFTC